MFQLKTQSTNEAMWFCYFSSI